jgi:hypothetical protein
MPRLLNQPTSLVALLLLCGGSLLAAQTPSFSPDYRYAGSSLSGWKQVGDAEWQGKDSEITGKGSGLLLSEKLSQDTALYLQFRCDGECHAGVVLQASTKADKTTGLLLFIDGSETAAYRATFDGQGKLVEKTQLRNAGGQIRFAPPASAAARKFTPPTPIPMPAGVEAPMPRPQHGLRTGDWNEVEVLVDADILRAFLNDGGDAVSVATDDMNGYGAFGLYVAEGTVHFRALAYKDIGFRGVPVAKGSPHFRKQQLSQYYYGWSAAAADFDHDGTLDIVSGPFIYFGPSFVRSREIYPAQVVNASTNYSMEDWVEHAWDFTGDGWPDVLTTSHAGGGQTGAVLYVNPKGESRRWEKHTVVVPIDSEETVLADIDGDGQRELVYVGGGYMAYAKPDANNPTGKWTVHQVSERGPWPAHGVGAGDVNGDGRIDILGAYGWWEQPAHGAADTKWTYHPAPFGKWGRTSAGGAKIAVYDVNGDGLADVVTTMQAHGWGMDWFEQKKGPNGEITFIPHQVMGRSPEESAGGVVFTEPHASTVADMDGDGIPDFIAAKRFWSHLDDSYDPDPYGEPVLYIYRTVRDRKSAGGAHFVPELVDNMSGGGSDVLAVDLNHDGAMDLVTSTRSGTYIFWGSEKRKPARAEKSVQ